MVLPKSKPTIFSTAFVGKRSSKKVTSLLSPPVSIARTTCLTSTLGLLQSPPESQMPTIAMLWMVSYVSTFFFNVKTKSEGFVCEVNGKIITYQLTAAFCKVFQFRVFMKCVVWYQIFSSKRPWMIRNVDLRNFLSIRFYVKSMWVILKSHNLSFATIFVVLNFANWIEIAFK